MDLSGARARPGPETAEADAVEWRISDGTVAYPEALAAMEERVAAIRAGEMPELVWLLEHPPLYTAGTSARAQDLRAPRPVHLSRAGPARRLRHARSAAAQARPAPLHLAAGGMGDPRARAVQRARRAARGPDRHLGGRARRSGGQDRRDRGARASLGDLSRRGDQPR